MKRWILIMAAVIILSGCKENGNFVPGGHEENPSNHWVSVEELGHGSPVFTNLPIDLNNVDFIFPLGHLNPPGHVLPTDHAYFVLADCGFNKPVIAPGDGIILEIGFKRVNTPGQNEDYDIFIAYTNNVRGMFGHLSSISHLIRARVGELIEGCNPVHIRVSAGDTLGFTAKVNGTSAALDFGIFNSDSTLPFRHPEWVGDLDYLHTVCPFKFFTDSLKELIYSKVRRTGNPRCGKVFYDRYGKLVGAWFYSKNPGNWHEQLSFVYDVVDPNSIRIGLGEGFRIPSFSYAVYGNSPNPAYITPDSGMVVYHVYTSPGIGVELHQYTIIVKMLDDYTIKVDAFEGIQNDPHFTNQARIFRR